MSIQCLRFNCQPIEYASRGSVVPLRFLSILIDPPNILNMLRIYYFNFTKLLKVSIESDSAVLIVIKQHWYLEWEINLQYMTEPVDLYAIAQYLSISLP